MHILWVIIIGFIAGIIARLLAPREFVVLVLKAVFRMSGDQAYRVMMTAHQRGACVIAVYTRDVAETKAKEGTELGKSKGYPLFFTTEPEE